MRRSKKFIVIAVLVAVVLAGSIAGVVLAADNEDNSQPDTKCDTLLNRVFEIYEQKTGVTIDEEVLKDAFVQARSEMRTQALQNRVQSLVEQGQVTQEQANQYLEWWGAKPDTPIQFGFGGHGGFRGMGGMRGYGGPCAPTE